MLGNVIVLQTGTLVKRDMARNTVERMELKITSKCDMQRNYHTPIYRFLTTLAL